MGDDVSTERQLVYYLWVIVSPILLTLGTIGNLLSIAVLTRRSLRSSSASVYLIALAIADTIVLLTGLLRQFVLALTGLDVRHISNLSCKIHTWLLYSFMDISVWIMVAFTFERFLSVFTPHKVKSYCTRLSSSLTIAGIALAMMVLTGQMLISFGDLTQQKNNISILSKCDYMSQSYEVFFENVWPWIDLAVYSLVPSVILVIGNSCITARLMMRRKKAERITNIEETQGIATTTPNSRRATGTTSRNDKVSSLTVTLLVLNLVFLVSTLPISLFAIIKPNWVERINTNRQDTVTYLTFVVVSLVNYITHSISFILYCFTGTRFRNELVTMFRKQRP